MNNQEKEKLEKLGAILMDVEKPSLSSESSHRMKRNVMKQLSFNEDERWTLSLSAVINYVKDSVQGVKIDLVEKARIKEELISFLEQRPQKSYFWRNFLVFNKKLISASLAVVMSLGFLSFLNMDTQVVRAESITVLEEFDGEVMLERGGETIEVYPGIEIHEADRIVTGKDGLATIKYFDDSVSRLAAGTELKIDRLLRPRDSYAESYVQVTLDKGILWSRVLSLVSEESSFVVQAMDVSAKAKKAAFNVEVNEDNVEIEVFNRSVDVASNDGKSEGKVHTGEKAVVNGDLKVEKIASLEKDNQWVKENLDSDEKHLVAVEQRLISAKMKSLGIDPEEDPEFKESLADKTRIFFTFNDVKRARQELDIAEKKFIAAEIKLNSDTDSSDSVDFQNTLKDFKNRVSDFYGIIENVKKTDPEYADDLRVYLSDKLLSLKKDLSVVRTDAAAKLDDELDELILQGVNDKTRIAELKLDGTLDKLGEAEKEIADGDEKRVDQIVIESKAGLLQAINIIEGLDDSQIQKKQLLVKKAVDYFVTLEGLGILANDNELLELKKKVDRLRIIVLGEANSSSPETNVNADTIVISDPDKAENAKSDETSSENPYGVKVDGNKPLPPGL